MKALCLIGSPSDTGSTALLVDRIASGLQSDGFHITRHALGSLDLRFCLGCMACWSGNGCVQQDDMAQLLRDLTETDVVVVGTPSYWGSVTAQLKTFIDRSLPLCDTRPGGSPVLPGKKGIAVAVRAGSAPEENHKVVAEIEHYFSHLNIEPAGRLTAEGVRDRAALDQNPEKLAEAYELGRRIGRTFAQY